MAITSEIIGRLGGSGSTTKVLDFNTNLREWTEILSPSEITEDSILVINLEYRDDNTAPELRLNNGSIERPGWNKDYMEGTAAYAALLPAGSSLKMRSFNGSGGGAYTIDATFYITYAPANIRAV